MLNSTRRAANIAATAARRASSKHAPACSAVIRQLSTTARCSQTFGEPKPSPLVGGNPTSGTPKRTTTPPRELLTVLEETIKVRISASAVSHMGDEY